MKKTTRQSTQGNGGSQTANEDAFGNVVLTIRRFDVQLQLLQLLKRHGIDLESTSGEMRDR